MKFSPMQWQALPNETMAIIYANRGTVHELFSTPNSSDASCSATASNEYHGGDE